MAKLEGGVVHDLPKDMQKAFSKIGKLWNGLTPLGRNEYICWITSAKKPETREKRIKWGKEEILAGKRRPCCWPGCRHR